MTTKVKLGPKANVFHDLSTGITIRKGQVKELNAYQLNSKRIKSALNSGHLVYTNDEADKLNKEDEKAATLKAYSSKLEDLYIKGVDASKASNAFTLDQLKMVALEEYGIEAEKEDTKITLVEAIFEEIKSKKEEKKK